MSDSVSVEAPIAGPAVQKKLKMSVELEVAVLLSWVVSVEVRSVTGGPVFVAITCADEQLSLPMLSRSYNRDVAAVTRPSFSREGAGGGAVIAAAASAASSLASAAAAAAVATSMLSPPRSPIN